MDPNFPKIEKSPKIKNTNKPKPPKKSVKFSQCEIQDFWRLFVEQIT